VTADDVYCVSITGENTKLTTLRTQSRHQTRLVKAQPLQKHHGKNVLGKTARRTCGALRAQPGDKTLFTK